MQTQALETQALSLPDQARSIQVVDNKSLVAANDFLQSIKALKKKINESYDPIIKRAHDAHKEAIAQKKKVEAPIIEAEGLLKPQVASYMAEQERIRREAEEKARKAEEERRTAEAEAEEERIRAAIEAEAAGDEEKAEQILNEAPVFIEPTGPAIPEALKLNGTSIATIWKFEVIDKSKIPADYLIVDEVKIGKIVRAAKGAISIPGIRTYSEKSVRT